MSKRVSTLSILKYAKDKYSKNAKHANIFNRKVRQVLAKYSKRFYELVLVELLFVVFSSSKKVFAFFVCT